MGADLTIVKTQRYFRDGYNDLNTWWLLGFSYWGMLEDNGLRKYLTEDGELRYAAVRQINALIKSRPFTPENVKGFAPKKYGALKTNQDWAEAERRDKEMREFWAEAVKHRSSVRWSV